MGLHTTTVPLQVVAFYVLALDISAVRSLFFYLQMTVRKKNRKHNTQLHTWKRKSISEKLMQGVHVFLQTWLFREVNGHFQRLTTFYHVTSSKATMNEPIFLTESTRADIYFRIICNNIPIISVFQMIQNSLVCSESESLVNNENLFNPKNPSCLTFQTRGWKMIWILFEIENVLETWRFTCHVEKNSIITLSNIMPFTWICEAHLISHTVQPVCPQRFKSKAGGDSTSFMIKPDINIGRSLKALFETIFLYFSDLLGVLE